ncbi:MAG: HD-GYP domain-containing protein [Dissulfurimicrobium sp.]|uniref:HD-GYP domain-containing protein n=1 Tax=Dissulfurimicrobium sp. TaxID=2022436 RepID=UPI003D10AF2F
MLWCEDWGELDIGAQALSVTRACVSLHQFAEALGNAIDAKDRHTYNHSQHVAVIGYMIALKIGFTAQQADVIHIAGHLHDIGKIGVPDYILSKKERLTEEEWQYIKRHPETGAAIIGAVSCFKEKGGIKDMVLHHHERYDGGGYPAGLRGNEIPIGARILSVADTFSAMIQDRPYRKAMSPEKAFDEIALLSGSQLDPICTAALLAIKDKVIGWIRGFTLTDH